MLQAADNSSMKEVKGLEDRLFGLDQLIQNASKLAKDQDLYAQVKYKPVFIDVQIFTCLVLSVCFTSHIIYRALCRISRGAGS